MTTATEQRLAELPDATREEVTRLLEPWQLDALAYYRYLYTNGRLEDDANPTDFTVSTVLPYYVKESDLPGSHLYDDKEGYWGDVYEG